MLVRIVSSHEASREESQLFILCRRLRVAHEEIDFLSSCPFRFL